MCAMQSASGVLHEWELFQGATAGLLRQEPTIKYVDLRYV